VNRSLILALCVYSSLASANTRQLAFDIYLDDRPVGEHRVSISELENATRVEVEAEIDVSVLSFPLYSYRHRAAEVWRGGCIAQLETRTDDDGEELRVEARRDRDALLVEAPVGRETLEGCVRTFAYWDPDLLASDRLLNTQTGAYESTRLEEVGAKPLTFNGRELGARHYRLKVADETTIDLWYSPDDEWTALETRVSGNRTLRYIRKENTL
jgi:hypothetical protein